MKSNEKLEMKFHLKAKYHIHSNLHVVKWSDKDGPPYMTTIGTVYESMMRNQRTYYLANQDNKHRLEDRLRAVSLFLENAWERTQNK